MTFTQVLRIGAFSAALLASAGAQAQTLPAPLPEPAPELAVGSTPAAGCPRFFIGLTLPRIDACAQRLAEAGWGLSAVAYRTSDATRTVDVLAGAFEPHSPERWLARDDEPAPKSTGVLVNVLAASDHLILLYQKGTARVCDDVTLYSPNDFHVADKSKYFATKMSERAAAGCVPGSFYALIRRDAIQQENPDEHVAFVPGDPRTTAADWPRNEAERKAFEKRAAARGFQRLGLDDPPDRWGKTKGPRYVQTVHLGRSSSRYEPLEGRLRTAADRGERIVDIRFVPNGDAVPDAVQFLWERTGLP